MQCCVYMAFYESFVVANIHCFSDSNSTIAHLFQPNIDTFLYLLLRGKPKGESNMSHIGR